MVWSKIPGKTVLLENPEILRRTILRLFHRYGPLCPSILAFRLGLPINIDLAFEALQTLRIEGVVEPKIDPKFAVDDNDYQRIVWGMM